MDFYSKATKFKKVLAVSLIETIAGILWVLSSQIGNRYIIGLLFLLTLFKFIVDGILCFLRYSSVKVLSAINIIARPVLPQYDYREYAIAVWTRSPD